MFIQKKNGSIVCIECNGQVQSLRDYQQEKHSNNPDWFWEPYSSQDNYLYVCRKCNKRDFISGQE